MPNYKDYYEASGQGVTNDDKLLEQRYWETGEQGQVKDGGSYGPGGTFPNGTVFNGATLTNFIKFGNGCIFINCKFNYNNQQPYSQFGEGCIFDNCSPLNGVDIPQSAVLNNSKVGIGNNQALINDTLVVGKDLPAISHTSMGATGTRIDSTNTVVTGQPGIKGYRSGELPATSKTEEAIPIDHYK